MLDEGETRVLINLNKPWYLYCNEHNNVPIPIPAYDYTVINTSLLCDCQLQGGNGFLHYAWHHAPLQIRLTGTCILQFT